MGILAEPCRGGPSHFPDMKTAAKIQGRASLGAEPDNKNSGQGPFGGLTQHKNSVQGLTGGEHN